MDLIRVVEFSRRINSADIILCPSTYSIVRARVRARVCVCMCVRVRARHYNRQNCTRNVSKPCWYFSSSD